jgi:hypothetical protein
MGKEKAALAVHCMKAFEVFKASNLFLPQTLLFEGGIADGAASFVYYMPSVPRTTNYDPEY